VDEELDDLLESEERLRVFAAWLRQPIEGYITSQLWRGDPDVFFLEADDGEVYAIERNDPSLHIELAGAP
jgi:hypothetical protein